MTTDTTPTAPLAPDEGGRFSALIDHIVETHHAHLRRVLPTISKSLEVVASRHGEGHPELLPLQMIFNDFRAELEIHLTREEQGLFSLAKDLERSEDFQRFQRDSLRNAMRCMAAEHDAALAELEAMRRLTLDFRVPNDASPEYRSLYETFAALRRDMREHVRKENEVLIPALDEQLGILAA